ncbi:tissue alpha-L-fucosidase-like [Rhipicephalus microplus]|uniref:tissue alpha-L-fucosidase-like n=1 Tax=Rhipicephalus microplus TaxID=6941 RepID=UPI003F6AFE82
MEGAGEQVSKHNSGHSSVRERTAAKSRHGGEPANDASSRLPPPGASVASKGSERDKTKRTPKKQATVPTKKLPQEIAASIQHAWKHYHWPSIRLSKESRLWIGLVAVQVFVVLYIVRGLRAAVRAQNSMGSLTQAPLGRYTADWNSLDTRPLPAWYDDAKVGVFVHWGVYSVPAFYSEWFWWHWQSNRTDAVVDFMAQNYRSDFTYAEFAPRFRAEFFDPRHWARLFKRAGARYVVLTSKHHDGYTLWPSNVSWNWNARDVGPRRDLVGELARAVREAGGLRFGLYYSLYEWFNPLYLRDKDASWTTDHYVRAKVTPELRDIVETYRPDVIWSDGDWEAPDSYWNSTHFLAWLYNDSPVRSSVVVNDRWGVNTSCRHGDVYACHDHYNPGRLVPHKWENAMPLDKGDSNTGGTWGYRRNIRVSQYLTIEELIHELVSTVSCNGNLLFNIGPGSDGTISAAFEERLTQLGAWLDVNGEAVYGSRPWKHQKDPLASHVWYTSKPGVQASAGSTVYAFILKWPRGSNLTLGALELTQGANITMLGVPNLRLSSVAQKNSSGARALVVTLPPLTPDILPTPWAWVLKVEGVA